MNLAIEMARVGVGKTFPKPSVGAVIIDEHNVILSAAHTSSAGIHAEPQAIEQALGKKKKQGQKNLKKCTLFVSLEPCNHHGKTPPCVDAIIESKIERVVIANKDLNPIAAGGINRLIDAGVKIDFGICEQKAAIINQPFFSSVNNKKPKIIVKVASSLDGKIALDDGRSKYITGKIARNYVQALRNKMDGILVGVNTVINDDPELSCRLSGVNKTLPKIILDTNYRTPTTAKLVTVNKEPVIIYSAREGKSKNAEIIKVGTNKNNTYIDLNHVMQNLASKGFERILVEGGGQVISSFIDNNLIDEFQVIYSPKIIGKGISFAENLHLNQLPASSLKLSYTRSLGEDTLLVFNKI